MPGVGDGATILVTGAGGFIGAALCRRLAEAGHHVVGATRRPFGALPDGVRRAWVPAIDRATDWSAALEGVDAVVHLAAPAHVTRRLPQAMAEAFRRSIVDGTETLARAVARRGARLVFVSTVKVHGERIVGRPFSEDDPFAPGDLYAESKAEAERRLLRLAAEEGLDHVVLRPPLVYGPGVKGNLRSLIRLCDTPLPLPFSSLGNRRSLIHLDNLIDAILMALREPKTGRGPYLLADARDYSTRELAAGIRARLGRPARSFPLPEPLVALASRLPGVADRASRLFASLAVESSRIKDELGWTPRASFDQGLGAMVAAYKARPAQDGVAFDDRPDEDGVSVVVVSYHNASLPAVLDAARRDPAIIEIIVVDNGNGERILAEVAAMRATDPRLRLVSGHGNVGFATGCNIGAALARGRHLLLLNPDCHLDADSVSRLLRHFRETPGLWVSGARLVNPDGSEQRGTRRNVGTPLQWLVEALHFDERVALPLGRTGRVNLHREPLPEGVTEVPAISGAFMFMPRRAYEAVGGMDPRYFLHFEDLDFCQKITAAGGRVLFCPEIMLIHEKSQSAASPLFVERQKCRSMRLYFHKHYSSDGAIGLDLIWAILSAGLLMRGMVRRLRDGAGPPPSKRVVGRPV